MQNTINERLKILVDALGTNQNALSVLLGISPSTFRNYTDRTSKPGYEILEKLYHSFKHINLPWLFGEPGEPLLPRNSASESSTSYTKNNYGNNVGSNRGGTVSQHHGPPAGPDERDNKLALAEKEIENLRTQLAMQTALLASKDETIAVLKTAFNRP